MRPGEILVVPTDGFEEALRPDGKMLGQEGMLEVVRDNRHKSAPEIVAALFSAARKYTEGRPQVDDMTVLVIKATHGD
jgi:sigma-B regulation protein RsbU (phosphoserine phosphatase)